MFSELSCKSGRFSVIGTADDAFDPLPNPLGIGGLEDIIHFLLTSEFQGATGIGAFNEYLREAGIIRGELTAASLTNGGCIVVNDGIILLPELS